MDFVVDISFVGVDCNHGNGVLCVKLYKLHKKPLKFPFLFALLLQTIEHFVILCYIAVLLF